MEIVFTVHNHAGTEANRRVRRSGTAARQIIDSAKSVLGAADLRPLVGCRIDALGITIHHLVLED